MSYLISLCCGIKLCLYPARPNKEEYSRNYRHSHCFYLLLTQLGIYVFLSKSHFLEAETFPLGFYNTVLCHLTMETWPEKFVIRWFCHYVSVTEGTQTNLDGMAYRAPRLHGSRPPVCSPSLTEKSLCSSQREWQIHRMIAQILVTILFIRILFLKQQFCIQIFLWKVEGEKITTSGE